MDGLDDLRAGLAAERDQRAAACSDLAAALADYMKALLVEGFDPDQALALTLGLQGMMLRGEIGGGGD